MAELEIDGLPESDVFDSEEDYFCRMEAQNNHKFDKTNDTAYEFSDKAFRKTSRLPFLFKSKDGTSREWYRSWNHERITNEAKALELVSRETSIPVPRLLDHGSHPDGRRYLITEYIEGFILSTFHRRSCSEPEGKKHTDTTPCQTCSDTAYSNAINFISRTVLPQLAKLTSRSRGIDGFVMPPSWLSPDVEPPWKGKQSWSTLPIERSEYIFQHGDLAAHNIIVDPITLQVKALIDWEYAGFYPAGMENWTWTLNRDVYRAPDHDMAQLIQRFLAVEYLECYDRWDDKAQLHELIKIGKLPHPDQLRQDNIED